MTEENIRIPEEEGIPEETISPEEISIPIIEEPIIIDDDDNYHDKHEQQRRRRARRSMKMSIIFGVRDRAQYAKKVIRSLIVQDLLRDFYEIVVVDFFSQDDLKDYIDLIKVSNLKYVPVLKAQQYDRARAFNIGAKSATHRILVFTEADLLFPKYALRMIRDQIIANEKQMVLVRQKNLQKLETAIIISKTYSDYGELLSKIDLNSRPSQDGCIVIERPHFDEVGGFDEDYTGESYEMIDFIERVELNGINKFVFESMNLLHMWHMEVQKEKEGYFWELYNRNKNVATSVRNVSKQWGALVHKKPKVLFMLSPQTWEPGSICKHVGEFLYPYYEVDMHGAREDLRGKTLRKYDMVFTIDWRLPKSGIDGYRVAAGVFDYHSWGGMADAVPEEVLNKWQLFDALAVPCKALKNLLFKHHSNTHYVPVAVDTEVFKPLKYKRRVSQNFTVGWVGKPEHQHTVEGFAEYIKPVCNKLSGVDLFTAPGGEDINGPIQMLGFYNAIDALVIFHETMGDAKIILEAMACGVPVITTAVGDVEEIIENNVNGIIVPRDEQSLIDALLRLKDNEQSRIKIGQLARETIIKQWDWRDKIIYWKAFFDAVMEII